jgi:hypothetical protein
MGSETVLLVGSMAILIAMSIAIRRSRRIRAERRAATDLADKQNSPQPFQRPTAMREYFARRRRERTEELRRDQEAARASKAHEAYERARAGAYLNSVRKRRGR